MERDPNARSGEILDDNKEKSKKKKSKVAKFISSKFSKLFREKAERDEVVESSAKDRGLTMKGRFLELIGVTGELSATSEEAKSLQAEEDDKKSGAVQKIRAVFSRLNIFESRVDEPKRNDDNSEQTPVFTQEIEPDHGDNTTDTIVVPEAVSSGTSGGMESGSAIFDMHEREHRKQKKEHRKIEKKIKNFEKEIDNQTKDNQELEIELERTQREVKKLNDRIIEQNNVAGMKTAETPASAPVEPASVPEKSMTTLSIEQPLNKVPNQSMSEGKEVVHEKMPEPSQETERTKTIYTPARTQTPNHTPGIENSTVGDAQEHHSQQIIEDKDKDSYTQNEKESLIDRIINPERKELTKAQSRNNADSKTAGVSGAAAPNVVKTNYSAPAVTTPSNKPRTKKKLLVTNNVYELVAVVVITLVAIVAFSLLAFAIFN